MKYKKGLENSLFLFILISQQRYKGKYISSFYTLVGNRKTLQHLQLTYYQMQIKTFQPIDHKIKAVVYGASGCGKTYFSGTAPKPIFASAEGGLLSIADKKPSFVEIKSLKDLSDLLDYLKNQTHDFETVIVDSITEINDIIKQEIEKKTGKVMQLQDWGELSRKIRAILRGFRDLPMHVLFISQETTERDDDKIEKIVPSLNGKASTEISYFMDIVGYLYIDKAGERKIITGPNPKLLTKDRSGLIGNDTDVNFNSWVEKIKKIKTGNQDIIVEHERKSIDMDLKDKLKDIKASE